MVNLRRGRGGDSSSAPDRVPDDEIARAGEPGALDADFLGNHRCSILRSSLYDNLLVRKRLWTHTNAACFGENGQ